MMKQNGAQPHNPKPGKGNRQPFGGSASGKPDRQMGGGCGGSMKSFGNKTLGSNAPKYK